MRKAFFIDLLNRTGVLKQLQVFMIILLQALVYQAFCNLFITETATLTQKSSALMKKIRYTNTH